MQITLSEQNSNVAHADLFDRFLTAQLQNTQHYLDDDGFSADVMSSIVKGPIVNVWLKWSLLLIPMLIISAVVFHHFPWRQVLQEGYGLLLQLNMTTILQLGIGCVLGVLCWILWLCRTELSV